MSYYLTSHMPLVEKLWGPQGLISMTVTTGTDDADYLVQATLVWESMDAWEKSEKVEVMEDVSRFTGVMPKRWVGSVARQVVIQSSI